MGHKDVLKQLFPIELGGDFDDDIIVEGKQLDDAQTQVEDLLTEMFPNTAEADKLLPDWERVFDIIPGSEDPQDARQKRVEVALQKTGGLSKEYFIQLAASMDYTITITDNMEEFRPFMTGWARTGDVLYKYEVIWIWKAYAGSLPLYYFEAGEAEAGQYLLWWEPKTALENLLNEFKPAHTHVLFDYS